jgi:hypothetical protein
MKRSHFLTIHVEASECPKQTAKHKRSHTPDRKQFLVLSVGLDRTPHLSLRKIIILGTRQCSG